MEITKEKAKREIKILVNDFENNINQYKKSSYIEHQVRQEFINRFFKFLGWDVYNEKRQLEQYKDVVNEDSLKISGRIKAPDYGFRIGGVRKFFVEAKKPSL
ncbi:MAG: hypothetical protein ABIH55_04930 [Nanoarchaeota archaeon]